MSEKTVKKTLSMSPQTLKYLEDYAEKRGLSISAAIRVIVYEMREMCPENFAKPKDDE